MPREHIAERNALEQSPLPPYHFGEFAEPGHACGGEIVTASAANVLSLCMPEQVAGFENAPALRERFIAWEGAFCPEPGAIDAGTHIIAAVRHRGLQLA
ncbi:MAG TPA: hypothetical protein VHI13_00370 [Candidatus Kapabacteria bacterium]|nr:hypothetical protein [Candidatus Kapabacteria bacterium]